MIEVKCLAGDIESLLARLCLSQKTYDDDDSSDWSTLFPPCIEVDFIVDCGHCPYNGFLTRSETISSDGGEK